MGRWREQNRAEALRESDIAGVVETFAKHVGQVHFRQDKDKYEQDDFAKWET